MRVLGVDPGARRIGVAVSDEDGVLASPVRTLEVRGGAAGLSRALDSLARIVRDQQASEVVIGLPLKLDGREGEAARRARRFASGLEGRVDVRVVLWDERMTTLQAERALREGGVRGGRQRQVVDQVAAAVILQSYLDARRERDGHGDAVDGGSEGR
ncbi:MAG: Holliday junction resolvase RuvX [Myxococcales bacterium]|jgi:putative Holliday junction resolvase